MSLPPEVPPFDPEEYDDAKAPKAGTVALLDAADELPEADVPAEIQGRSLSQIAWRRLRRDKVAMASLVVIILIILSAIFAPLICSILGIDPYTQNSDVLDDFGNPAGPWANASWQHPLGVEPQLGRDMLARILYGARTSLLIALSATVLSIVIGVVAGVTSGYLGGWVDNVISRLMDILLAFPVLLFSLAFLAIIQAAPALQNNTARIAALIFTIGFFGWPYIGRVIRGQVLTLREKEFIDAARSIGAGSSRIVFRELVPNIIALVLVYATLIIPTNILAEAALSYLGVGLLPPDASWGQMLSDSVGLISVNPFGMFVPGMAIFITVLVWNLFGDGLRDAFDPRGQR